MAGMRVRPGDYVTNALRAVIGVVLEAGEVSCLVDWPGTGDPQRAATDSLWPVTIWCRGDVAESCVESFAESQRWDRKPR